MNNIREKRSLSLMLVIVMFFTVFFIPLGMDNSEVKAEEPGIIVVTLNPSGGFVTPTKVTVSSGSTYTGLPSATKTGFKFLGWYASDGTLVKNGMAVNPAYTILTAKWQANKYTITYNNKGKLSKKKMTVTFASKYGKLPKPKRTGYAFLGWFTKKSGGEKITSATTVATAKNHTLYAHWGKNSKVKFNANGGTVKKKTKSITQGKKYGALPKPKRSGYYFRGWYTKKSGGTKITKNSVVKVKKNSTLYAHWTKAVTVSFDATGGFVSPGTKKVGYRSQYGTLPTAYKSNEYYGRSFIRYIFDGWFTSEFGGIEITATSKVNTKTNHTLYAHWWTMTVTY